MACAVARSVPSHYLNQCRNIVYLNKLQCNINQSSYIFIQENAFENVVWCRPFCLDLNVWINVPWHITTQRTHDAKMASFWPENNVATWFWRHNDAISVVCPLGSQIQLCFVPCNDILYQLYRLLVKQCAKYTFLSLYFMSFTYILTIHQGWGE